MTPPRPRGDELRAPARVRERGVGGRTRWRRVLGHRTRPVPPLGGLCWSLPSHGAEGGGGRSKENRNLSCLVSQVGRGPRRETASDVCPPEASGSFPSQALGRSALSLNSLLSTPGDILFPSPAVCLKSHMSKPRNPAPS